MKIDFWEAIAGKWRYKPDGRKKESLAKLAEEQAEIIVNTRSTISRNPLVGWEDEDDDE